MSEEKKLKQKSIRVTLSEKEGSIIIQALDSYVKTMNEANYVHGIPIEEKRIEIIEKLVDKIASKF